MCLFCRERNAEIYRLRMQIRSITRQIENLKDDKKLCICGDRRSYFRRNYLRNRDKKIQAAKERYRLKKAQPSGQVTADQTGCQKR